MISKGGALTVKRQSELLDVNRSSFYRKSTEISDESVLRDEFIKSRLDYWHCQFSWMGSRKLADKLRKDDKIEGVGRHLVRRYMREMGIFSVYPKPNLSKNAKPHKKFPYLLRNKVIWLPNQVWAIDITYISLGRSHMYLTAIIDWYSRFIVGWALSDTLETAPVLDALRQAMKRHGVPAIINSDQGSQFTSTEYTELLRSCGIRQSMDGKARWVDNVIIERWFRSLKMEYIYINEYANPRQLRVGICAYIEVYNYQRPHASLDNLRPAQVYSKPFYEQAAA
jgi:putative transposase